MPPDSTPPPYPSVKHLSPPGNGMDVTSGTSAGYAPAAKRKPARRRSTRDGRIGVCVTADGRFPLPARPTPESARRRNSGTGTGQATRGPVRRSIPDCCVHHRWTPFASARPDSGTACCAARALTRQRAEDTGDRFVTFETFERGKTHCKGLPRWARLRADRIALSERPDACPVCPVSLGGPDRAGYLSARTRRPFRVGNWRPSGLAPRPPLSPFEEREGCAQSHVDRVAPRRWDGLRS